MKKKIIISIAALVGMSCLLGLLNFLLDSWETKGWYSKIIAFFALLGWAYITYGMITLKFKWIRKLAE